MNNCDMNKLPLNWCKKGARAWWKDLPGKLGSAMCMSRCGLLVVKSGVNWSYVEILLVRQDYLVALLKVGCCG